MKHIPSHPDIFIKTYRDEEEICKLFETCKTKSYHFEQWKKTPVTVKSRSVEEKVIRRMKIVNQEKSKADFEKEFVEEIAKFIEHSTRIKEQFKAQRTLKQRLQEGLLGHVYIHLDFAEDYRCRCQEEIQSAYWSQTQITLHLAVI